MQHHEDLLLGKLAVREKLCTQEQIDECLQMQAMMGPASPLGDLLLFKGYLSAEQVKELLSRQHKKLMSCRSCVLSFTVLTLSAGKSARCPKCKGELAPIRPEESVRTDAEFETGRVRLASAPPGPKVKHECIVCDQPFEEAVDASGRVRCPACRSSFTANPRG